MKTLKALVTAMFAFLVFSGSAQETGDSAYAFTLQEAQQYALKHNQEVINARLDIEIAEAKIKETTAIGLPQVEASATYTHVFNPPEMDMSSMFGGGEDGNSGEQAPDPNVPPTLTPDFVGNFQYMMGQMFSGDPQPLMEENSITFELMATQLIFSGEYIVGLQASRAYKSFSETNAVGVEIDAKEKVANSYFAVLIAEENLRILDSSLIAMESMVKEMQRMAEVGLADQNDADQLKLNLSNLKTTKIQVELQTELAGRVLKYNVGLPMDADLTLKDDFNALVGLGAISEDVGAFNPENHIQYQMLQVNEELMKLSMKREQSTLLPSLAAFAKFKEYDKEPQMSFEPKSLIGVKLTVPIFGSGMKMMKIKQAKIEYLKAQNSSAQLKEGLILGAEKAEVDLSVAVKKYEIEQEKMELAKRIFDQTIIKHKTGMASSFELTTAQNQFLQTQQSYFQAMFDVLNKKIAADKAFGKL